MHNAANMHSTTIAALSALTGLTALHVCMGPPRNMPAWTVALSAMGKLQELGVVVHPLSLAAMETIGHAANLRKLKITCSTPYSWQGPEITAAQARSFLKASEVELYVEKFNDCVPFRAMLELPNIKLLKSIRYPRWQLLGGWSLDKCACWGCVRTDPTGQRRDLWDLH